MLGATISVGAVVPPRFKIIAVETLLPQYRGFLITANQWTMQTMRSKSLSQRPL